MKLLSVLALSLVLVSCGKKAKFDGRSNPNDPVGSDPVTLDAQYKRTESMNATVTYNTTKVRNGGQESSLSVRNEGFKIPQELTVTKGWASHSTTAQVTITAVGFTNIVCTYASQATGTQTAAVPMMSPEYSAKGLKYTFSNCNDNSVDPTVVVDGYENVVLRVNSASNLETETSVEALIKIYE